MLSAAAARVAIIVPGFTVAPFADEALASLRAQTFPHWRAILVNDGSTDATGAIFDAAAAADPRFHVIHHARQQGLSAARNDGLDAVSAGEHPTEYVGFLDADDVMAPHALERLIMQLDASGNDLVAGAYVRLRPDESGGYSPGNVQPWVVASTSPARTATTLDEHPEASGNIVAWSKLSRLRLWNDHHVRFPLGRLYEDQLVAQKLYHLAGTFDMIPDVIVQWRERADGSSITQAKGTLPVLQQYLAALTEGIAYLGAHGHPAAAAARVALIRQLDLPPLVALAAEHSDPAYRAALDAFVHSLAAR